ncbi:MAG: hypothetical protein QOG71_2331 [Pyrinomonadaceae bacterium]|nr:hypothetical protein [Pyrinomonadaceae bacterium]
MKAQYLGSAGNIILLLCACGFKLKADRDKMRAKGFTACGGCKSQIGRDLIVRS